MRPAPGEDGRREGGAGVQPAHYEKDQVVGEGAEAVLAPDDAASPCRGSRLLDRWLAIWEYVRYCHVQ
jgi:hypothetical protein